MFLKAGVYSDKLSLARAEPLLSMIRQTNPGVQVEKKTFQNGKESSARNMMLLSVKRESHIVEPLLTAVLENKVDFGVFNLRDLPTLAEGSNAMIAAIPERSSPYDVLVTRNESGLRDLKPGSVVGASTLLRIVQLRKMRPDLKVEPISGTVEDRLSKLDSGELDAIIAAESGLARLGMSSRIAQRLALDDFMPLPGQGITALVSRRDNQKAVRLMKTVDSPRTRKEAEAERELLRLVKERSKVPLGAYASTLGDNLHLSACMISSDGQETIRAACDGPVAKPLDLARNIAASLFDQGALRLEEGWRKSYPLYDD